MMLLADLDYVLIKATHTGDTREISLKDVRMEIAENRLVGGRPTRAYEVEECNCPQGYTGLSCQVRAERSVYNVRVQCIHLLPACHEVFAP